MGLEKAGYDFTPAKFIDDGEDALLIKFTDTGKTVKYVPEHTCKRVPIVIQLPSFYDEFSEEFETMCCSSCEEPLSDNWAYCPQCGAKVVE